MMLSEVFPTHPPHTTSRCVINIKQESKSSSGNFIEVLLMVISDQNNNEFYIQAAKISF